MNESKDKPNVETNITIKFANASTAHNFAVWLCEHGEQDYWDWMERGEEREEGDITATSFHYHGEEDKTKTISDPKRYGTFMCDNIIRTTVGRLDKDK